jgi:hypothetical protein
MSVAEDALHRPVALRVNADCIPAEMRAEQSSEGGAS